MKMICISGNIGKDAVTRTAGDTTVTGWSVAVEHRQGQDKLTIWFDCNLWGKRGDTLAQYLTKGSKVTVAGDFATREHEGKTYLTIRVDQVTLGGGGQERGQDRGDDRGYQAPDKNAPPSRGNAMDDEIPFAPSVL
jgi:single-strand DNA-binding protein